MANLTLIGLLPEADVDFLKDKHPQAVAYSVGNEVHVLFPSFAFSEAYQPRTADLLVRLPPGYPDATPDMFWTRADVKLLSGAWPQNSEHHEVPGAGAGVEVYGNVPWQRWSRHMDAAGWRVGVDGLRSFMRSIRQELDLKR